MSKKTKIIGNITVVYRTDEEETANIIESACAKSIELAREIWGLGPPEDCHIYVMTSWMGFFFQSAPWAWRILLGATVPAWAPRARRTWPYSAAWTQKFGRRTVIGIKPPGLIAQSKRQSGIRMFVEEKDDKEKIQHVTCHELVHACSAHLRLPMWLNEGIATTTVDKFLGKQTFRQDTLEIMKNYQPKAAPPAYREMSRMGLEAIAFNGSRGYWLTRYIEDEHPGFLRGMFSTRRKEAAIDGEIAKALGMEPEKFWTGIDDKVTGYYLKQTGQA